MSTQNKLAMETWWRYQFLRDNGHLKFIKKAKKCDRFFAGDQWSEDDKALLLEQKRPALTINKILPTLANITGEQIYNRTEITFRPRKGGATEEIAEALNKVFVQISDNNQLSWTRTDVFLDGLITSRGFFDVRLDTTDSLQGDARVKQLNPKNVLIDGDASSYDTSGWNDVLVTKWLTLDDVELIYGKKWRKKLDTQASSMSPYAYDQQDWDRDQFGDPDRQNFGQMDGEESPTLRVVRIVERQHKQLRTEEHFVHLPTGEIREIPEDWEDVKVELFLTQNTDYTTVRKTSQQIRWTVVAGEEVLHDDWSPYKYFTVVPFFPYFRRGNTIGVVENLLGPQELLNKTSSQELHVINTTANSGWIIKADSLRNMSAAELEERGAQTGLVLEMDDVDDAKKIQPNQVPTGLDRLTFKAEEHIKSISGVPDASTGFAREDVSAKALQANQVRASSNYALVQDNLQRTDHMLAVRLLDIVQTFYTEERIIFITTDTMRTKTEEFKVNEVTPEGEIAKDLTLGEYSIVITNQPERDTLEDSTFAQLVEMRKDLNVDLPDSVLIQYSRIPNKSDVIEAIEAESNSPEAKAAQQLQQRREAAEVGKIEADTARDQADAESKRVKTQIEALSSDDPIEPEVQLRVRAELAKSKYTDDLSAELKREEMAMTERIAMAKIKSSEKTAAMKPAPKPAAKAAPKPKAGAKKK
jgi:hypothetical protein